LLPLLVVPRPQPALDHPAQRLDRAGRDDALRRAADAEQQVDARARPARHDRARHVAVHDELDPRPGLADLLDDALVPRPVEDADGHADWRGALGLTDRPDVVY